MTASLPIVSTPRLTFCRRKSNGASAGNNGNSRKFRLGESRRLFYDASDHSDLPHVVKFSGGRTSGMMLFSMLEGGALNPARGDVVIFNNTSAEHPATYEFVRLCKKKTESYGIPFFWLEFQTYEDVYKGRWWRLPAYRLANENPRSDENPNGYHWRGELFEELVSWKGFVPNQHSRVCTEKLKLFVTREFLSDWFARKSGIDRLGHSDAKSRMVDDEIYELHRRSRGETPREIFITKKAFVRSRPPNRPAQLFADYSAIDWSNIQNPLLRQKTFAGRVDLSGDNCADYLAFVGFRADEPHRVARMRARNQDGDMQTKSPDLETTRPDGEYVYAPLAAVGATRENVNDFWSAQNWGLVLPKDTRLSNCVFCFLKGKRNLVGIVAHQREIDSDLPERLQSAPNTPSDIDWWRRLEEKYGRDLKAEARALKEAAQKKEKPIIGFFGLSDMSYGYLQKAGEKSEHENNRAAQDPDFDSLPCECTD